MGVPRFVLRDGWLYQTDGKFRKKLCRIEGETLYFWWKPGKVEHPVTVTQLKEFIRLVAQSHRENH